MMKNEQSDTVTSSGGTVIPGTAGENRLYPLWHVLLSSEPQRIYDQLTRINATGPDSPAIEFYVPSVTFKEYNIRDEHLLRNHSALRRFVFLRLSKRRIDLLRREHRWTLSNLGYSRDHAGNPLTVRDAEMRAFISLCTDLRIDYEIWPTLDGLEVNERVRLLTTPFAGWEARILACRTTRRGNSYTVGLDVLGGTLLLHLKNLSDTDFERHRSPDRRKQEYRLVEWVKGSVKQALDYHVACKSCPLVRTTDGGKQLRTMDTLLAKVWSYRPCVITSPTCRRHLHAMLLICAVLRKDSTAVNQLVRTVDTELGELSSDPGQKRPTDTWATLHAALYLATKDPAHRTFVKEYQRRYLPKSAFLQSLIQIVRRFEV